MTRFAEIEMTWKPGWKVQFVGDQKYMQGHFYTIDHQADTNPYEVRLVGVMFYWHKVHLKIIQRN